MENLTSEQISVGKTFSDKERAFYERNRAAGFAPQEAFNLVLKAYRKEEAPKGSAISRIIRDVPSDIAQTAQGVAGAVTGAYRQAQDVMAQARSGDVSTPAAVARLTTIPLGAAARGIGELSAGATRLVSTPELEQGAVQVISGAVQPIVQSQLVQSLIERYKTLDPEQKSLVDSALDVGSFIAEIIGGRVGRRISKQATLAAAGARDIVRGAADIGESIVRETAQEAAQGAKSLSNLIGSPRIASRARTNLQDRITRRRAINELPTEEARIAARDGIEMADVNAVLRAAPDLDKGVAKRLLDTVRDIDAGVRDADEAFKVVGEPLVNRIKSLDAKASEVGKELGTVAKSLGSVTKQELTQSVLERLRSVMPDVRLKRNGELDFSKTQLTSRATAKDRSAIQDAFNNATKGGSGTQAHRYRQELFEILDGKKRALENVTATQDRALNAIRGGISDVLSLKNPRYAELSAEYAKIMTPLGDIRRLLRASGGLDEDILSLNAGILARRLTGSSMSQGDVRAVLRELDAASSVLGGAAKSTEALQELYNVLNRYYRISPRTGFQGQTESAIETSITGAIGRAARETLGQTPAVRQRALEQLVNAILK